MEKTLRIRRQENPFSEAYFEEYKVPYDDNTTIAVALLNLTEEQLKDRDPAHPFRSVAFDHSCHQKRCGACAMVINDRPALACDTRLSSFSEDVIKIEPLKKFPVILDLLCDRSSVFERLKDLKVWIEGDSGLQGEEISYEATRCIKCGLCLEVCPNFYREGRFGGMAAMAEQAALLAKIPPEQRKAAARNYRKSVFAGCGKSLACRDICPVKLDIEELLVRSNAAAIWKRWLKYQEIGVIDFCKGG